MAQTESPAAFERDGASQIAQLGGLEPFHPKAAGAEFQRIARALQLEALSLSGGSQFAAQALSAHFCRRSEVCS